MERDGRFGGEWDGGNKGHREGMGRWVGESGHSGGGPAMPDTGMLTHGRACGPWSRGAETTGEPSAHPRTCALPRVTAIGGERRAGTGAYHMRAPHGLPIKVSILRCTTLRAGLFMNQKNIRARVLH